jgi:hypothetical protein
LFGKAEGKKLLGRPMYRNDTKMYLKEIEKSGKMWTGFICLMLGTCSRLL